MCVWRANGLNVGAIRRAEWAGAVCYPLGLLVPDHGRGDRRGERAAGHPRPGRRVPPAEPAPGLGRRGEGGAEGTGNGVTS